MYETYIILYLSRPFSWLIIRVSPVVQVLFKVASKDIFEDHYLKTDSTAKDTKEGQQKEYIDKSEKKTVVSWIWPRCMSEELLKLNDWN